MYSHIHLLKKYSALIGLCAGMVSTQSANATIVQFQTVMGDFSVNLYDKTTPKTVENFLAYVKSGAFDNSIIHRSVPGFIVQGGGYQYNGALPLVSVPKNSAVVNEPIYANKRGTIAMAKLEKQPNSATNQWFFNLSDNSANLDNQNEGFTVFGEVTGNGMGIIDSIAALTVFNVDVNVPNIPLRSYTPPAVPDDKNFVLIKAVVVLDANIDTAASLTPIKSTKTTKNTGGSSGGGGGGGSTGWLSLLLLAGMAITGRKK